MPRPIDLNTRKAIVEQCSQGRTFSAIAQEFGLSFSSVRRILRRWRDHGQQGLGADYRRCGHCHQVFDERIRQKALRLKHDHLQWGAGFIKVELKRRFPGVKLPHCSTLCRWFAQARYAAPRSQMPVQSSSERAKEVHQVWQVDGKEAVHLANGQWACWLDIVDECSGAALASEFFSPKDLEPGQARCSAARLAPSLQGLGQARQAAL